MDGGLQFEDQIPVSITVTDEEIAKADTDSESEQVTSQTRFGVSIFNADQLRLQRIEEGSNEYEIVRKSFVGGGGMGELGEKVEIGGVYRKVYDLDVMDEARLKVFRVFAGAVARRNDGDPNIKFGWYGGGSRDEVKKIMVFGFTGGEYGGGRGGVRLSPANAPVESARTLVPDSDGLMHLILCRVILGKPQQLSFGSYRDQLRSLEFDSGVDNLLSPKTYIVSEYRMNSHILPLYIISFRVDSLTGTQPSRRPTSPHRSITGLINRLTGYVSSSQIAVIKKLHRVYIKNRISRPTFIRHLRMIVGDDVLRVIVQSLR